MPFGDVLPSTESAGLAVALAASTLVSEDAACAAAGALVAEGRIAFGAAVGACFAGIVGGDLLLFAAGRVFGRRVLDWSAVRRRISPEALERSSAWIERRGAAVVLASRFTPGTRLPTCLAAGLLRTRGTRVALWFVLAAALWTPLIVGAAAAAGQQVRSVTAIVGGGILLRVLFAALLPAGALAAAAAARRWRVRRRLSGWWQRITRWEFWPVPILYLPVCAYIAWLMLRYRSLTAFAAANPAIPGGGLAGESKYDILRLLAAAGAPAARAVRLGVDFDPEQRMRTALDFLAREALTWPVVLKPDVGQRGAGVAIVPDAGIFERAVREAARDLILQEHVPGIEFGVFYIRHPGEERGRIFSLTEKRFPCVVGDGARTLEDLILADPRAVCLEHVHRAAHRGRLADIPAAGARVPLVQVGSHCRGALFLDAMPLLTPELETAVDAFARRVPGFHFGRFDVRVPSIRDLQLGRGLRILELNGVTSEATHIYDPGNRFSTACRVLCEQWRLAFAIGAANLRRGAPAESALSLMAMTWRGLAGETARPRRASKSRLEEA